MNQDSLAEFTYKWYISMKKSNGMDFWDYMKEKDIEAVYEREKERYPLYYTYETEVVVNRIMELKTKYGY